VRTLTLIYFKLVTYGFLILVLVFHIQQVKTL